MLGLLTRFFKGGLSIDYLMFLTWPEVKKWHDRYIKIATEENVIQELSVDPNTGKSRELPSQNRIQEIVNSRIKKEREKFEQETRALREN